MIIAPCSMKTLAAVAATPFSQADTIPPMLYSSEEVHALERERIFAKEWLCPGLAADVPNPGDYITFSINDQPVLTLRGEDGVVNRDRHLAENRVRQFDVAVAVSGVASREDAWFVRSGAELGARPPAPNQAER